MLPLAERERVEAQVAVMRREIRDRVTDYVSAVWASLGSWRDADIDQFVELVVPRVQAAQLTTADLTAAAIARMLEAEGVFVEAVDVDSLRGGVAAAEVYRRPAVTLYTELKAGKPFDEAFSAAAARLGSLVATDMQLAFTHQSREVMTRAAVEGSGFRRVLTGRENCAKCMIASTQRYHRGDLNPLHPGCDCGVLPLEPGENTGQVIDPDRLEATHDWVQSLTGRSDRGGRNVGIGYEHDDYADLILVRDHGEYGPTLSWRSQSFTGPQDVAA